MNITVDYCVLYWLLCLSVSSYFICWSDESECISLHVQYYRELIGDELLSSHVGLQSCIYFDENTRLESCIYYFRIWKYITFCLKFCNYTKFNVNQFLYRFCAVHFSKCQTLLKYFIYNFYGKIMLFFLSNSKCVYNSCEIPFHYQIIKFDFSANKNCITIMYILPQIFTQKT